MLWFDPPSFLQVLEGDAETESAGGEAAPSSSTSFVVTSREHTVRGRLDFHSSTVVLHWDVDGAVTVGWTWAWSASRLLTRHLGLADHGPAPREHRRLQLDGDIAAQLADGERLVQFGAVGAARSLLLRGQIHGFHHGLWNGTSATVRCVPCDARTLWALANTWWSSAEPPS